MPSYADSHVSLRGAPDALRSIIARCFNDDGRLDFEKIIPKPEGFDAALAGGSDEVCHDMFAKPEETFAQYRAYPWVPESIETVEAFQQFMAERMFQGRDADGALAAARELADRYQHNIDVSGGARTWYDWNCNHWGTKWNALGHGEPVRDTCDTGVLEFDVTTAWCEPLPVFDAIVFQHPGVVLDYRTEYESDDDVTYATLGPVDVLALPAPMLALPPPEPVTAIAE